MVKKTPFYERVKALNETMLWEHWAGYLVPQQYQYSTMAEYYAIRNSAGLFDTSPLFKYRIRGRGATKFLRGVLTRDVGKCGVGEAQYTVWCDDGGWVLEDGVVLRVAEDEYWLTAAEPNLRYLQRLVGYGEEVVIEDVSAELGILAIQGPLAAKIMGVLTADVYGLDYFELTKTEIAGKGVILSRTGYTGDLGYEVWVRREDGLAVWDAIMGAGAGYNLTPFGQKVLHMARIEAGMILIGVEYETARHAWVDEQRSSPLELGFGWMVRRLKREERAFIGKRAIVEMKAEKSMRWQLVGIEVDWRSYEKTYNQLGLIAPKDNSPIEEAMTLYDFEGRWLGHTTSYFYSSVLKKHIALAKVMPAAAGVGTEMNLELMILNRPRLVKVKVVKMPFLELERKTAEVTK
ncbi:MAG TPA: aminomethyltransferase family protein [Anaerolineae bacterium]|nr:aminomethyltransferase family protein [Anaerolineae bacterium]